MNFNQEIRKHFEEFTKTIIKRKNDFENILTFINEYSKCETYYVKGLRKVYSIFPQVDLGIEFIDSIHYLREHIQNKLLIHESYNNSITSDILNEGHNFLEKSNKKMSEIASSIYGIDKDYLNSLNLLEKSKNNYSYSAKKTEEALYDLEMSKKDYLLSHNCNKFETNAKHFLDLTRENEKNYINTVNQVNDNYNKYLLQVQNILNECEQIEKDFTANFKFVLEKFYGYSISLTYNQKTNLEYGIEITNKINTENENSNFLKNFNKLLTEKPKNYEFQPYEIALLSNKTVEHDDKFINVIKTMKNNLKGVAANFDEIEDKNTTTFTNLLKIAIYHGECMNKTERNTFYKYIKSERKYQKKFLFGLNSQRNDGRMEMNHKTISLIGTILTLILDCNQNDCDFELIKFTLILSQTFYYKNRMKEKIYLQKQIMNHSIFQKINFWLDFVNFSIEQALNDNSNKTELFLQNSYFSQLLAITNNMLEFQLNKEKIYEIIEETQKKYDMNQKNCDQIIKIVEDKVYVKNEGNKMKTIRSSDTLLDNKDFREKYEIAFMEKDDFIAELDQEDENDYK